MTNDDLEQRRRIEALKEQAKTAAGGHMMEGMSASVPLDIQEQFWQRVVDFENSPMTDLTRELAKVGIVPPAPESLSDSTLHELLWTIIHALADMNVFLGQTNHLSERELYALLRDRILPEEMEALDDDGCMWHIDVLGGYGEEEVALYLRYYAAEDHRRRWLEDFPEYRMPPHEDPPFDRDRHLPGAYDSSDLSRPIA